MCGLPTPHDASDQGTLLGRCKLSRIGLSAAVLQQLLHVAGR